MIVAGVDPGLKGAVALLDLSRGKMAIDVWDMPVNSTKISGKDRDRLDLRGLQDVLDYVALLADVVIIEDLSGRPSTVVVVRNGKKERIAQKGLWEQGFNCCAPIQACVATRTPYELVTPAVWKKRLKVPSDKASAKRVADRIYPQHAHLWPLVKHDGRAEAVLLAHWYLETHRNAG